MLPRFRRNSILVAAWLMAIAAVVGSFDARTVLAQAPGKSITELTNSVTNKPLNLQPFLNNPKLIQPLRGQMLQWAQNGKPQNPQETESFDTYVLLRIAELTWPAVTTTSGAEQKRMLIKREARSFASSPSPEFHDRMNQHFLAQLPKIAADNGVDMSARVNAMILLGQVDRVEPNSPLGVAAVPLAEVTPILIAAADKQDLPESLRIAALMGLARQSELQIVAGTRPPIAAVATKLIAAKKPLPGFSENGHHWARKLALQSVTGLAKTGSDFNRPEVVKALYDIINDDNEPLFLRRDAALAVGQIDPATIAASPVKPLDLLKALSRFTHETLKAGSTRANPNVEPTLTKGEDVFLPPSEETKRLYTDGLSYYLNCVATALGGRNNRGLRAASGADPNTSKLVNELLVNHVDAAVAAMGSPRVSAAALPQDMSSRGAKLASWMTANNLNPAPAAAAAGAAPGTVAGP